jgi:hypothetical protein
MVQNLQFLHTASFAHHLLTAKPPLDLLASKFTELNSDVRTTMLKDIRSCPGKYFAGSDIFS